MYCPNCGSFYDDDKMLFCKECGCPLNTDSIQTFIGSPVNNAPYEESSTPGSPAPAPLPVQADQQTVPNASEPVGRSIIRTVASSRLFLTAAISYTLSIVLYPLAIISSSMPFIYRYSLPTMTIGAMALSIPGILTAVAIWMLFSTSRKAPREPFPTAGLTILKVLSIIQLVVFCVFCLLESVSLITVMQRGSYTDNDFPIPIFGIVLLLILFVVLLFLYFWKLFKMTESAQRMAITGNAEAKVSVYVAVLIMLSILLPLALIVEGTPLFKIYGLVSGISTVCFSLVIFRFRKLIAEAPKTSAFIPADYAAPVKEPALPSAAETPYSFSSDDANNTICYFEDSPDAGNMSADAFSNNPFPSWSQDDLPANNSPYRVEEDFSTTPIHRQGSLYSSPVSPDSEAQQLARQQAEQERLAREQAERERLAREQAERERIERERAEAERLAREQAERERLAREQAERERIERERAEAERLAREQAEQERLTREKAERERLAREQAERERIERERAEAERLAREQAEQERIEREREKAALLANEQAKQERLERERAEAERLAREKAEQERIERENEKAAQLALEKAEQEKIEFLQSGQNNTSLLDTSLLRHTAELVRKSTGEHVEISMDRFRIGRNPRDVDYFISDNPTIGRHHADIIYRGGRFFIVDLNSTNHVYLNGVMITPGMEIPISDLSEIRLSDETFSFRIK